VAVAFLVRLKTITTFWKGEENEEVIGIVLCVGDVLAVLWRSACLQN
jgi:hypothetical protein